MGWMQKLINRHNGKERCLVCSSIVKPDAAIVEYRYDGGTGQAFLCETCEERFNETKLDGIDDTL